MRPSVRARVVREGVVRRLSSRGFPPPHPTCGRPTPVGCPHPTTLTTTPVEGYLGSRNDEERSEMRYVM